MGLVGGNYPGDGLEGWIRVRKPPVKGLKRIRTAYWLPGTDYVEEAVKALKGHIKSGDILAVSEKALAVALGLIVDEKSFSPSLTARVLAGFWMRRVWGWLLGPLCRLKPETWRRLREYPSLEGARHKQMVLQKFGLLQALRFSSEGGVDASNLPEAYVSLPLPNPKRQASRIHQALKERLGVDVTVMVVDSDKTYSLGSLHLSPNPQTIDGIKGGGGILYYMLGRILKLKPRSTPKAVYPEGRLPTNLALELAEIAHQAMSRGKPKTVWDLAETFGVGLTEVTWEMLESLPHHPLVLLRLED
ncbi:MAG: coenzyme F420-0:L-glutamate ligase [Candidatus Hecatellaceae archaeon]